MTAVGVAVLVDVVPIDLAAAAIGDCMRVNHSTETCPLEYLYQHRWDGDCSRCDFRKGVPCSAYRTDPHDATFGMGYCWMFSTIEANRGKK